MEFSLKKYITEKLQSDILVKKLLNDTGGMFKYYKIPAKGTMYYNAKLYYIQLQKILDTVDEYISYKNSKHKAYYNFEELTSDKQIIALHDKYMKLYDLYIKYVSNIFSKPDPNILSTIISGYTQFGQFADKFKKDLYNITDENFKCYKLSEIISNSTLLTLLLSDVNDHVVFWINKDNKILVATIMGLMVLFALDNDVVTEYEGKRFSEKLTKEIINNAVKPEKLTVKTFTTKLDDNVTLTWPIIKPEYYTYPKTNKVGIDFIDEFLNLHKKISNVKYLSIGNTPFSKKSKLYKYTNWGDSSDDYLIIYEPEHCYGIESNSNVLSSYNDIKIDDKNSTKYKHSQDFIEILENTYKWLKNLLGQYKPYANGKDSNLFEFGKKLSNQDYDKLYGSDNYCNRLALTNMLKYKLVVKQKQLIKDTLIYKLKSEEVLNKLQNSILIGKTICINIKSAFKVNKDLFNTLITLYGVYMKLLNISLDKYSWLNKAFVSSDEYTNRHDYTSIDNMDDTIKHITDNSSCILIYISGIETNIKEMFNIETKINELLGNI